MKRLNITKEVDTVDRWDGIKTLVYYTYNIEVTKAYIDSLVSEEQVLNFIKRNDTRKVAKALYAYFKVVMESKMEKDLMKVYDGNTKKTEGTVEYFRQYKLYDEQGERAIKSILINRHIAKLIARLISKGKVETEKRRYSKSFKSRTYNYQDTYYSYKENKLSV